MSCFSYLAPLAGRGRIASSDAIRVRGTLRESELVERAPHPNPLPVKNGERERRHSAPLTWTCYFSFVNTIVPLAANMPPTPWHTEIFAFGTCAGAMPRICRTLSCSAYIPYMPECM
jgi:hypothetical protein